MCGAHGAVITAEGVPCRAPSISETRELIDCHVCTQHWVLTGQSRSRTLETFLPTACYRPVHASEAEAEARILSGNRDCCSTFQAWEGVDGWQRGSCAAAVAQEFERPRCVAGRGERQRMLLRLLLLLVLLLRLLLLLLVQGVMLWLLHWTAMSHPICHFYCTLQR